MGVRFTQHEFEKSENRAIYSDKANSFSPSELYSGTMPLGAAGYTVPKR